MLEGQIGLPNGWLTQPGLQEIDIGCRCGAGKIGDLLGGVWIEYAAGRGARGEVAAATDNSRRHTGIGKRISNPHGGSRPLEQADTATQLHGAFAVERVIETKARLDEFLPVERVGIVQSKAAGLPLPEKCSPI